MTAVLPYSRLRAQHRAKIDELGRLVTVALDAATTLEARSARLLDEARRSATMRELDRVDEPAKHAVSVQERSANPKLAPQRSVEATSGRNRYEPLGPYTASTYASISATCPDSCPFKDAGCFAQAGASHLTMKRLDDAGRRVAGLEVSLAEAEKLSALWPRGVPKDGAKGGRDLRLHVGGDVSCEAGARTLKTAVSRLRRRGLGACWTYTHRWREIPREAWGGAISALASCESSTDVQLAVARGYAAALTVDYFPDGRRTFELPGALRGVPCPYEAGIERDEQGLVVKTGPHCVRCRLCFDTAKLRRRGLVIVFAAHGSQAEYARERLREIASREAALVPIQLSRRPRRR